MSEKGLVIVYTGGGKGKTTAALGLALRAIGYNHKVCMIQFIKGSWHYGEMDSSKKLAPEFELIAVGKGFVGIMDDKNNMDVLSSAYQIIKSAAISSAKWKYSGFNNSEPFSISK